MSKSSDNGTKEGHACERLQGVCMHVNRKMMKEESGKLRSRNSLGKGGRHHRPTLSLTNLTCDFFGEVFAYK